MEKILDNEFEILRVVKDHPNVAKIYALQKRKTFGGWEARELMEYCPIGLFDYVKNMEKDKKYLPEDEIWEIMYDCVSALGFMHKQQPSMVHRDIKLENIMQGKDGRWKLIDFGSVVRGTIKLKTKDDVDREEQQIEKYTTQMYRAPEMVDFFGVSEITEKTDIWALGCILYTLMFMKQPFANASKLAILGAKYTIPPRHRYSPDLVDLLKRMLCADPAKRGSAVELFKIIKAKVGKRVPHPAQTVASNFRDEYDASDDEESEESEFDDEVITEVSKGKRKANGSKNRQGDRLRFKESDSEDDYRPRKSKSRYDDDDDDDYRPRKAKKASRYDDDDDEDDYRPRRKPAKKASRYDDDDEEEEEERPRRKPAKKASRYDDDEEEEEEERPRRKPAKKAKKVVSEEEEEEEEEEERPRRKPAKKAKKVVEEEEEDFGEEEEEPAPRRKPAKKASPPPPADDEMDFLNW